MKIKFEGLFNRLGESKTRHEETNSAGQIVPYEKKVNICSVIYANVQTKDIGRISVSVKTHNQDKLWHCADVSLDTNSMRNRHGAELFSRIIPYDTAIIVFTLYDFDASIDEQHELMSLILKGIF